MIYYKMYMYNVSPKISQNKMFFACVMLRYPKGTIMSRFDNKLCPVCRIKLTEKSDVVVCPECGTPHHRTCYLSLGRCGVEEYHAKGFEWNGRLPDEPEESPQKAPEEATAENTDDGFSREHRAEYPGQDPYGQYDQYEQSQNDPYIDVEEFVNNLRRQSMNEGTVVDGVSNRELSTFVGRSLVHYAQAFTLFRAPIQPGQRRRKVFINLCAGFFAPIHQFYRRMDLLGIAATLVTLLSYVPYILSSMGVTEAAYSLMSITRVISFAAMVLLCVFGDYLYYRYAVKRILKIRAKYNDGKAEGYYEALAAKGNPSWLRAIAGALMVSVLVSLITMGTALMGDTGTTAAGVAGVAATMGTA